MTEQPRIKCAIPQSWQIELESLAQQTGQSVEQVVYEAIARYLGKGCLNKSEVPANVVTQMQSQLKLLESRLAKADMALMQTALLAERVLAIEQLIGRSGQVDSTVSQSALYEDDDIADEPDEILTSFLESDDFQDRLQAAIDPITLEELTPSRMDQEADQEYEDGEILYDFIEP
jgi:hypothetical protein